MTALAVFGRALQLLLLGLVPSALPASPPAPSVVLDIAGLLVVLGVPLAWFLAWRRVRSIECAAAAIAWPIAMVVAIIGAAIYGDPGPLLRAYVLIGPVLWITLAVSASFLAGHYLTTRLPQPRPVAAMVILGGGLIISHYTFDSTKLKPAPAPTPELSIEDRAKVAVPDPVRAVDPSAKLGAQKLSENEVVALVEDCAKSEPKSCACLTRAASLRLRQRHLDGALEAIDLAKGASCGLDESSAPLRAISVFAYARKGDYPALTGALDGAPARDQDATYLYGDAIVASLNKDPATATKLVKTSIDQGGGRDPKLFYAWLLIAATDYANARTVLTALSKGDPADADVVYDLALLDDYKGDYNSAREGYLSALRLDPKLANARYNLAWLTFRRGIVSEAKHHVEAFARDYPDDPRIQTLERAIGTR